MHAVTRSDIYEGYYIPKGMSYMWMLYARKIECSIRRNCHGKLLVRSSHTPASVGAGSLTLP